MEQNFNDAVKRVSFLRDTKSIGELSELIVAAALARAGYLVSMPVGENARYDLIVDKMACFRACR
jgi:PD-(D/E)XK endonuclease